MTDLEQAIDKLRFALTFDAPAGKEWAVTLDLVEAQAAFATLTASPAQGKCPTCNGSGYFVTAPDTTSAGGKRIPCGRCQPQVTFGESKWSMSPAAIDTAMSATGAGATATTIDAPAQGEWISVPRRGLTEDLLERLRDIHRRHPSEYQEICSIIDGVRLLDSPVAPSSGEWIERAAQVADDFATVADATFLTWKQRAEAGTDGMDIAGGCAIGMAHQARCIAAAIRALPSTPKPQNWRGNGDG